MLAKSGCLTRVSHTSSCVRTHTDTLPHLHSYVQCLHSQLQCWHTITLLHTQIYTAPNKATCNLIRMRTLLQYDRTGLPLLIITQFIIRLEQKLACVHTHRAVKHRLASVSKHRGQDFQMQTRFYIVSPPPPSAL